MFVKLSRLAVVAASMIAGVAFPLSAQAAPAAALTCAGSYAIQFHPGVTTTPQNLEAHVTYRFSLCASLTDPKLTSGAVDYDISRNNFSCLNSAVDSFQTGYSIHWNTGETSTVNITGVTVAETTAVTGTVTAGAFTGQPIVIVVQGLSASVLTDCASANGITSFTGAVALELV
jgi:hypothetical protein